MWTKKKVTVIESPVTEEQQTEMFDQIQEQLQSLHTELSTLKASVEAKASDALKADHEAALSALQAEIDTLKTENAELKAKLDKVPAGNAEAPKSEKSLPTENAKSAHPVNEYFAEKAKEAEGRPSFNFKIKK